MKKFKLNVTQLANLKTKANEEFACQNDCISDLDYGQNPITKKWDVPCIEWEGLHGKHWQQFDSEQARTAAINMHDNQRRLFVKQYIALETKRIEELERNEQANANTLENLCPELAMLKAQFN